MGLFIFWLGCASAQSPSLRFDPKWRWPSSGAKPRYFPSLMVVGTSRKQEPMPKAWQYKDLAFFCKMEVKMEKAARFPIKFRLGDVPYVERLEGKIPSY